MDVPVGVRILRTTAIMAVIAVVGLVVFLLSLFVLPWLAPGPDLSNVPTAKDLDELQPQIERSARWVLAGRPEGGRVELSIGTEGLPRPKVRWVERVDDCVFFRLDGKRDGVCFSASGKPPRGFPKAVNLPDQRHLKGNWYAFW